MSHTQTATVQQLDALLDFLDDHRDLARGHLRCADGREKSKRLWEEVTQMLNSIGGSIKNTQQWQKVWTDRKHLAKKMAAANKRSAAATGGGPSQHVTLSPWELRVLQIMGEGFGEPQTTASVPAFPQNWNFLEEFTQASTQPPTAPQASSQPLLATQALFRPPSATQASPRPPSSQRCQIAQASSQPPLLPQTSSHSLVISQASPPSPLITQSMPLSPVIAQSSSEPPLASSSNQERNNLPERTRTRRRVTSRRGAVAEESLQQRFFEFESKRLQLEQQKLAELRGLKEQHAQLTNSLRGIPELTLTLRELIALMKEFMTRQSQ